MCLFYPLIWMLFAFVAFWLIIRFVYFQFYEDYNLIFWIIVCAYSWVTLVRSVRSLWMIVYDMKLQASNHKWYIDTVDESDFKDGRYEKFLRHSFISIILQFALMVWNAITSFIVENGDSFSSVWLNILEILINIGFLWLIYKTIDRIIDYEMDFNIFTDDQFVIYRQHGLFKAESMNIATSTVKIVQESKSWFWWSLFHYWTVSIHPEWNIENSKAIELFFVPHTKDLAKKLNEFIETVSTNIKPTTRNMYSIW